MKTEDIAVTLFFVTLVSLASLCYYDSCEPVRMAKEGYVPFRLQGSPTVYWQKQVPSTQVRVF